MCWNVLEKRPDCFVFYGKKEANMWCLKKHDVWPPRLSQGLNQSFIKIGDLEAKASKCRLGRWDFLECINFHEIEINPDISRQFLFQPTVSCTVRLKSLLFSSSSCYKAGWFLTNDGQLLGSHGGNCFTIVLRELDSKTSEVLDALEEFKSQGLEGRGAVFCF